MVEQPHKSRTDQFKYEYDSGHMSRESITVAFTAIGPLVGQPNIIHLTDYNITVMNMSYYVHTYTLMNVFILNLSTACSCWQQQLPNKLFIMMTFD